MTGHRLNKSLNDFLGMKKILAVFVLVGLLLPVPVFSQGFSSIVDDGRLKISLHYPVEVKIGACFTVGLQITFLGNVNVDKLRFSMVYVSEAGSVTLVSDTLVSTITSFTVGQMISKTYSVCIPTPVRRDPLVEATVYTNYTRDASYKPLTHKWYLATVRNRTYDEVVNDLNAAQNQINTLQRTVQELQSEITRLRARVEEVSREAARLVSSLESSRREYERLEQSFQNLSNEYARLNDRYVGVVGELRSLETLYESLRRENAALMDNYRLLLSDYRNLTKEYNMLQASYNQLQTIYENLSTRHESAKQQIGYLQSQLDETQRSLADLRMRYNMLNDENVLHRNLAFAEAFALLVLFTALAVYGVARRTRRPNNLQTPALPLPPPPPQNQ